MKQVLLLLLLTIFQTITVGQGLKGTVKTVDQSPVSGADIVNISGDSHAHSDIRGNFHLKAVNPGDTLRVIHLGYSPTSLVVKSLTESVSVILEEKSISLDEVVITPDINALTAISDVDIHINPVNSSQEILRQVPGLIIGQHAGGGKAEQIFLRGFDIDHGTDINITSDGIPVNMVSHAHGQGYADLHFIIPETIDKIDFGKGPYYAEKGNFTTAGYVNFKTKNSLKNSLLKAEAGQFNTYRLLGLFDVLNTSTNSGYLATEYISTDGPFESPQNFHRINLFGKYNGLLSSTDRTGITLSHFSSKWDASGQIPQRAVDAGLITRFGAIDDTEGGFTGRTNIIFDYDKIISETSSLSNKVYFSQYDFELYSNFTFFLEDSINGDQIKQKENRTLLGLSSTFNQNYVWGNSTGSWRAGFSLRNDKSNDNELSHTRNRSETLDIIQFGNINETNIGGFIDASLEMGKWIFNPVFRVDYFDFQYNDALSNTYQTESSSQAIVSPKLNILHNYSRNLQLYLKTGKGFHSNDTRVVLAQRGEETLPAAYGFDAGFIWKPTKRLFINTAYWYLFLEQEFVYVGDAGIVEPSGKTRRQGLDFSVRHQPLDWLFGNLDVTYAHARAFEEREGQDYIPLAPEFTLTGSLNVIHNSGLYGGLHVRHISDRPANEDYSIVAKGYTIFDLNTGYKMKQFNIGIQIQNLLDTDWNETQFATESRLVNEANPVEEIHFIPGTPFNLKATIEYKF